MTNYLKIDMKNRALVYDRAFAKNCFIVGTTEYTQLQEAMKTFPNFKVEQRSIRKNEAKECYKGLNYDYMRKYIDSHETGKNLVAVKAEFEEKLNISKCHSIAYRYPTIKKWFLDKYPEVKEFGQTVGETSPTELKDGNITVLEPSPDPKERKTADV